MIETVISTSAIAPAAPGLRAAFVSSISGLQCALPLIGWACENHHEQVGQERRLIGSRTVAMVAGDHGRAVAAHTVPGFARLLEALEDRLPDAEVARVLSLRELAAQREQAAELTTDGGAA